MDLRDLRYFVAVAQAGSTRLAAERVHRSQPTLIKAIDRLEASLQARLFERDGRGQRLSTAGSALLERALPLLAGAQAVRTEVSALGRGTAGLVRLGSGPLGAEYLLPRICGLLLAEAPDVRMQLTIRMSYELREELRKGAVDVVLGFVSDRDDEFVSDPLIPDTAVVVAARSHPVFSGSEVSLELLSRYRWALPNESVASRAWLDGVFAAHDLPRPDSQIETNSIPLIPHVIAHTELLSFVSRRTLLASDGRLREVELPATTMQRNFGVTYASDLPLAPAAKRLIGLLRAHGQRLFDGHAD